MFRAASVKSVQKPTSRAVRLREERCAMPVSVSLSQPLRNRHLNDAHREIHSRPWSVISELMSRVCSWLHFWAISAMPASVILAPRSINPLREKRPHRAKHESSNRRQ